MILWKHLRDSDSLQFFGENTEEKRITNAPIIATTMSDGVYKPLYERLKEQREEKENEWKEKHNPFGMSR